MKLEYRRETNDSADLRIVLKLVMRRAIGWLIRRANSAGRRRAFGQDWWRTKDAALRKWARRDGWDLQVFKCWGYRAPYNEGSPCSADCERCDGTGIHRAVELERWRVGPYVLHRPGRVLNVAPVPPAGHLRVPEELLRYQAADRKEAWIEGLNPEKVYFGRIQHRFRRGYDSAFWLLLALLGRRPWSGAGTALLSRARNRAVGAYRAVQATISAAWYRSSGFRIVRQATPFYVIDQFGDRMPCPECLESGPANRLVAEIGDVHRDGTWEAGGLRVWCANDSDCWSADEMPAGAFSHRMGQEDWVPVSTIVGWWARDHVRVFDSPLAETSDAPPYPLPF